jgi:hypothetical protein
MTVFTPDAVNRMVKRGAFREVKLRDLRKEDYDEAFYFRFPSSSVINEVNGDGDWLEVWEWDFEYFEWINCEGEREFKTNGDTIIYVR